MLNLVILQEKTTQNGNNLTNIKLVSYSPDTLTTTPSKIIKSRYFP